MPRLTCSGTTIAGLPSTSAKELFISGCAASALTMRVPDQVGEADLATAATGEVVVDHDAVVREQLGRDGAHAGRGRHARATRPCSARSCGDAAQRDRAAAGRHCLGGRGLRGRGCLRRARAALAGAAAGLAGAAAGLAVAVGAAAAGLAVAAGWAGGAVALRGRGGGSGLAGRLVVGEEVVPRRIDAGRIGEVPLVHLLDDPLVGTEAGQGLSRGVLGRHVRSRPLVGIAAKR